MKKILALLLALVMVFALVACGSEKEPTVVTPNTPAKTPTTPTTPDVEPETPVEEPVVDVVPEDAIIIGHLADLTDNEASTGILGQKAVDFAAKLINEQGGIAGRPVYIETFDCQSNVDISMWW